MMARCCGGSPRTNIEAGLNIEVTGIGTLADPFVISTDLAMVPFDTDVFDVAITGSGTAASPWVVSVNYAATAQLTDLPDVDAPAPTNGQVLAWDTALAVWKPVAPTTAASGSVTHNTSLSGDGSVGAPLQVVPDAARYLANTATGVGINDTGINQMNRRFADDTARNAASPAPVLNSLSTVNTRPGQVDFWNGSTWVQVLDSIDYDASAQQLLSLSGAYANGPITMMIRKFSGITDATGQLQVLSSANLSGKAGVLSATITVTGVVGYHPTVVPGVNNVLITARRLDDGVLLASQAIEGQVIAYVY